MIFPRIVGTFVPRIYIYCCGYIDGKRNNVLLVTNTPKDKELFYFRKKSYDYNRFISKCFYKLNKTTSKFRSEITRNIKIYNTLKDELEELNSLDFTSLTLRENRKKTIQMKETKLKYDKNIEKLIKQIEKYNTKILKMYNHVHKNENKLKALLTQYLKGVHKAIKLENINIIYPMLEFEKTSSFTEFNETYDELHADMKNISEVILNEKNNKKVENKEEKE